MYINYVQIYHWLVFVSTFYTVFCFYDSKMTSYNQDRFQPLESNNKSMCIVKNKDIDHLNKLLTQQQRKSKKGRNHSFFVYLVRTMSPNSSKPEVQSSQYDDMRTRLNSIEPIAFGCPVTGQYRLPPEENILYPEQSAPYHPALFR